MARSPLTPAGARLRVALARGARPQRVCLHEAAHAVVGHVLGYRVFSLSVHRYGGDSAQMGPRRPDPLQHAMVALAGHAAEVLWCRQPVTHVPQDDHLELVAMGFKGRSFPTLLALAQGQCRTHEVRIRAVAAALKARDLDRKAFLSVLRAAPVPARGRRG